jgi:hypothetical protein
MSLDTFTTRPHPTNPNVRFWWVYDPYHETRGSYAYDTEQETRDAEDAELANLESGTWVALGCVVQHRCPWGEWHDGDSLWGIVMGGTDAELAQFESDMDLTPPKQEG